MRKIYVVGGALEYANWMEGKLTNTIEEADLVVFTGGEDVSPSLYNETPHPTTFSNMKRDLAEVKIFEKAQSLGKHIIGICRGSQFLCVMNGGKLVQHQANKYLHPMILKDGRVITVTSTHHQAQFPFNLSNEYYVVLGWGENESPYHYDGEGNELSNYLKFKECEIVYYPFSKCLGIQSHPERESYKAEKEGLLYFQSLLTDFLNYKIKI